MWVRFQIWRIRRRAQILSRRSNLIINAKVGEVTVGRFRHGREVR